MTYCRNSWHLLRTNENPPLDDSVGQYEQDDQIGNDAQAQDGAGAAEKNEPPSPPLSSLSSSPSGSPQHDQSPCKGWRRGDRLHKQTVFFKVE